MAQEPSQAAQPPKLPLSALDQLHFLPLARAIANVFAIKAAEDTVAQLINGLPLAQTFWEARGSPPLDAHHPVYEHIALCAGSAEQMRDFRADFNVSTLELDAKVF